MIWYIHKSTVMFIKCIAMTFAVCLMSPSFARGSNRSWISEAEVLEILSKKFSYIHLVRQIPHEKLREASLVSTGVSLKMADPNEPFARGDFIVRSGRPTRRLIIAGVNQTYMFIAYECGGDYPFDGLVILETGKQWKVVYSGNCAPGKLGRSLATIKVGVGLQIVKASPFASLDDF